MLSCGFFNWANERDGGGGGQVQSVEYITLMVEVKGPVLFLEI